jgi:hypothetical protein
VLYSPVGKEAGEEMTMDKELMEQLQELIDALRVAERQAHQVAQTLRNRDLDFGPQYLQHAEEIMRVLSKARRLQLLAEKSERET